MSLFYATNANSMKQGKQEKMIKQDGLDGNVLEKNAKAFRLKLKELTEELELKMTLGGMEARDAWSKTKAIVNEVSHSLDDTEYRAKELTDEGRVRWHLAVMDAKDTWKDLKEVLSEFSKDAKEVKTEMDTARVQVHLARLDARDSIEKRKKSIEARYESNVKPKINGFISELNQQIDNIKNELTKS